MSNFVKCLFYAVFSPLFRVEARHGRAFKGLPDRLLKINIIKVYQVYAALTAAYTFYRALAG